jgi:hypothetical protein
MNIIKKGDLDYIIPSVTEDTVRELSDSFLEELENLLRSRSYPENKDVTKESFLSIKSITKDMFTKNKGFHFLVCISVKIPNKNISETLGSITYYVGCSENGFSQGFDELWKTESLECLKNIYGINYSKDRGCVSLFMRPLTQHWWTMKASEDKANSHH